MVSPSIVHEADYTKVALHYGNMRFAMFTVFTAVLGGLLAFPFSEPGLRFFADHTSMRRAFGIGALLLSILFTLAELRISYLVSFYQAHAFMRSPEFPRPSGHRVWSVVVGLTMISPYIFAAIFWIAFSMDYLNIK